MTAKPLIIAHRGASAVAPENTMSAFRAAIDAGADGIEFDVQLSCDHIPVIIHDENLKRTGLLDQRVTALSADELRSIDVGRWFSQKHRLPEDRFRGEGIPLLQEVIDLYRARPGILYLEMKCAPTEVAQLAAVCCEIISRNQFEERVVVECFHLSGLKAVKSINPFIRTAALFEPKLRTPQLLLAQNLVEQAIDVSADEIALHHRLARRRVVEKAHSAGLNVVVWTVDDLRWVSRAQSLKIDAMITNDPAPMLRRRQASGID